MTRKFTQIAFEPGTKVVDARTEEFMAWGNDTLLQIWEYSDIPGATDDELVLVVVDTDGDEFPEMPVALMTINQLFKLVNHPDVAAYMASVRSVVENLVDESRIPVVIVNQRGIAVTAIADARVAAIELNAPGGLS